MDNTRQSRLDAVFMKQVLKAAEKARGLTRPNPMVGALVVRDGKVVGRGYHRRAGEPHAEVIALAAAGRKARGATLYVNLEPCCHTAKRTPPCTRAILAGGVRRVVVGMIDPNPRVRGGGIRILRRAGIRVTQGVLEEDCRILNETYVKFMTTGRPFVILKAGMTLDGKIGRPGRTVRITGREAVRAAHRLRGEVDAVVVGRGTVVTDNPRLTVRLAPGRDPDRVILDSAGRIPVQSRVFSVRSTARTIVAVTGRAPSRRIRSLEKAGAAVWVLPARSGKVRLKALMAALGRKEVTSVMIEGGSEVNAAALAEGIVDKIVLFVAPVLLGPGKTVPLFAGDPSNRAPGTIPLRDLLVRVLGRDLLIEARLILPQPAHRRGKTVL